MVRCLSFVWFLLLSAVTVASLRGDTRPREGHDIWDSAAGFPGGYVHSIAQTADGYLWVGTSKGLLRYDGLTFASIPASESGARFPVLGLITDSADQLWAADERAHLYRYGGGRLVGPLPDNGRHQYQNPPPMIRARDGWMLFTSAMQGMIEYERGIGRVLLDPSRIPNRPTAVAQTADGTLWIGTLETGLFRVVVTQGAQEIQHVAGLETAKISSLLPIGPSTLLIGTDKGLLAFHDGDVIRNANPELGNLEILALTSGQKGDVWIGTDGHLFKAHAKDIHADGRIDSLDPLTVHGTVSTLFEDRDGNLWIGGPERIERYRESGFTTYLSSDGLPSNNSGAIYVDPQQRVWFAPWDGGLFQLSKGRIQQIEAVGLKDDTVYSIAGGAEDEVWVARKYGGITRLLLPGGALQASSYTRRNGLAQDAVDAIYRAVDGSVWAGTLDDGLSRFRGGNWRTFTSKNGLPSNRISVITGNAAGNIFVGTPSGLGVLKDDHWVAYTPHDGLPPGPVESLYSDKVDTLWIGTTKGISFLESGTIHVPIGAPNALYGEILGIVESNGWLWVTTRDHVARVRRDALLKQSIGEGDYREFGTAEGLPSTEGVKRSRSVVEDNRGQIWFSLNQGISVLGPSAFAAPSFPVTTRVDGILVDGRLVTSDGKTRIPAGRHRLTVRYAGVNVSNPDGVRYRYRLDNVDSGWSEPTALREIDYTNIPPGRFQFHVMARNPDGIWSGNEAITTFDVEAAFWQTRWFQAISVAVVILLVLGLYRMRLRQLHRQFSLGMEERVGERTRIARELHDTLLQSFHGLMFQFQAARNMLPRSPENAMQTLDEAILSTEKAIAESRDAIRDLRPEQAAQQDLAGLLTATGQELTANREANAPSPVFRVVVEGETRTLSPISEDEIHRIAREVIRNAFHHAVASLIEVEIRYDARQLRLRIRDDGKGVDAKVMEDSGRTGHWGLPGIRERAERIGSRLEFWSEAGAGTEVELTVPAAIAYEARRESPPFRLFPKARR
jgi:signal transduction histidine kinase/ligand-binding sensor domain-containing protein